MIKLFLYFFSLFFSWLILSGYFDIFFLSLGIISCIISLYIAARITDQQGESDVKLELFLKLVIYSFWIVKEIVKSSMDVTKKVWQRKIDISPQLSWVPVSQKTDVGLTILANSITLTPGTVSVGVRKGLVYVHALEKKNIYDLRNGQMDSNVTKVIS